VLQNSEEDTGVVDRKGGVFCVYSTLFHYYWLLFVIFYLLDLRVLIFFFIFFFVLFFFCLLYVFRVVVLFLYCFVYCFSFCAVSFLFFAQVYRQLPPGASPVAANKYHQNTFAVSLMRFVMKRVLRSLQDSKGVILRIIISRQGRLNAECNSCRHSWRQCLYFISFLTFCSVI
jgi:hypothetical protein